ncbi:MAG: hypothetical protein KDK50_05875, partial [Chlamydiia bacterium]|nr:hypothetical protein [Chlamydiia bacterium]
YDPGEVFHDGKMWLTDNNYDYIHNTRGVALVWNNKQFKLISGSIQRTENYLIADLYDATNNKIVRLASLHINGYPLESIQYSADPKRELQDQHLGVANLMDALGSNNQADFTIIGSDTNSIPSIYSGFHQQFESAGYSYDKTDSEPTNYHKKEGSDLIERQLDFIFKSYFLTAEKIDRPELFKLTAEANPSDHVPVIHSMTVSFFSRLLKVLYDFFTWKPSIKIDECNNQNASGEAIAQTAKVAGNLSQVVKIRE